ncbi:MAG: rfaG [Rhodocyclaceae bacterium]|nr:rfaG [Rhodocyclaceae bacterium]
MSSRKLRILTWHVHGNYLYYLSQVPHTFYVLSDAGRSPGYAGRAGRLPWGDNVVDLPVEQARDTEFDCILFQSRSAWETDQHRILSKAQQKLPRVYLEHDPPQEHPTNTRHPVDDPDVLVVHVTPFNQLMWDNGRCATRVVEHGVMVPAGVAYDGSLPRGIAVVNHMARRGRRLGADVFEAAREWVPIDLVGMEAEKSGGLGEIPNPELPAFLARYRFYFHPIRWTSLGLAAIEAMMVGLPVVGLATTELATVVRNGESGYIDTDLERLFTHMGRLIANPEEAFELGLGARRVAKQRFNIRRFVEDWEQVFDEVAR